MMWFLAFWNLDQWDTSVRALSLTAAYTVTSPEQSEVVPTKLKSSRMRTATLGGVVRESCQLWLPGVP